MLERRGNKLVKNHPARRGNKLVLNHPIIQENKTMERLQTLDNFVQKTEKQIEIIIRGGQSNQNENFHLLKLVRDLFDYLVTPTSQRIFSEIDNNERSARVNAAVRLHNKG